MSDNKHKRGRKSEPLTFDLLGAGVIRAHKIYAQACAMQRQVKESHVEKQRKAKNVGRN